VVYGSTVTLGKSSALSLTEDLNIFAAKNNVLSKCQIGFLPNYRTTDHVITLIDKKKIKIKGKIFFVEFKKSL
jgi:hypothetical protein